MTNEEKAKEIANDMTLPWVKLGKPNDSIKQACEEMAEWKDKQQQELIDRACEWLKNEACKHIGFDAITEEFTLSWDFLEEFKKAIISDQ